MSQELGAKRQVFFVSLGGFDTHDALLTTHPTLMTRLGAAMRAFHDAMVEIGAADKVTAFTASDFGRTLTSNADGSDHGWGSMHFVMGGAVHGRDFYGTPPVVANNGPDDVGQGRLLPALGVDQYGATLASWFGVAGGNMSTVLPNIVNYNPSTWNLGFVMKKGGTKRRLFSSCQRRPVSPAGLISVPRLAARWVTSARRCRRLPRSSS